MSDTNAPHETNNDNTELSGTELSGREKIIEVLKTIEDPELFIDIWFLGLIYGIDINEENKVAIQMTFTSAMCPAGPWLVDQVKTKVEALGGFTDVSVKVVFSPPWSPSEDVRAMLGLI